MLVLSGVFMIALGRYRYPKGAIIALPPECDDATAANSNPTGAADSRAMEVNQQ
jgi:hypothetical protein